VLLGNGTGGGGWAALREVRFGWLALAILAAVTSWLLTSTSLLVLGRAAGFRRGITALMPAYMAGNFCGLVTPFGSGGTPGQAYFVSGVGVEFGQALAVAVSRGLISSTIVASAAGVAVFLAPGWLPAGPAGAAARTALVIVAALLVGATMLAVSRRPAAWIDGWAARARHPTIRRFWAGLASHTDLFRCALRAVAGKPSAVALAVACEAASWVLIIAVAPLVLRSLGWEGPAWAIFLRTLALFLLIPMSPTPGSAGSAEVGFFVVGKGLVDADVMAAAVLLWRAVLYYLPLLVGGICFTLLSAGRTSQSLRGR